MPCCGKRRAALRTPQRSAPRKAPVRPVLEGPVPLAYTGSGPIIVRGAATGLTYAFPEGSGALAVDARDASRILATGRFRRV